MFKLIKSDFKIIKEIILTLFTKKKYENVEHHTIKFGDKYKEHLDDIFVNKKLNNDISYYLHRPTATDSSMAPKDHDCFYVLVPVPNNKSGIDWSVEGENLKKLVIDKMEKSLLPNLKENIVDATPKLADIMKLKVRNFNWKNSYKPNTPEKMLGFIAQEFEEVFPSLIKQSDIAPRTSLKEDEDHVPNMKKSVVQGALIPALVKAMQEQQALIEELQAEVKALKEA